MYTVMDSPLGLLLLRSDGASLTGLFMVNGFSPDLVPAGMRETSDLPIFRSTMMQLTEYFDGVRLQFDLQLSPGGTEFQKKVWTQLREIPYGETISYGELARRIQNPNASRAVGLANGKNPLSLVIPCHRVIGADGALTGYGGGLPRKSALLDFEREVQIYGARPMKKMQMSLKL